jgi:hypothetical protein
MGRRLTRPAARLLGCFPSIVDAALVAALVLFNALVFLAYFQGWLGAGWTIDCPGAAPLLTAMPVLPPTNRARARH